MSKTIQLKALKTINSPVVGFVNINGEFSCPERYAKSFIEIKAAVPVDAAPNDVDEKASPKPKSTKKNATKPTSAKKS